jgi:hypothetical protein
MSERLVRCATCLHAEDAGSETPLPTVMCAVYLAFREAHTPRVCPRYEPPISGAAVAVVGGDGKAAASRRTPKVAA